MSASREERMELAERPGTIKRLHVDRQLIAQKASNPITIQTSKGSIKASGVEIQGASRFVYQPDDPLSCGARLWIETTAPLKVFE